MDKKKLSTYASSALFLGAAVAILFNYYVFEYPNWRTVLYFAAAVLLGVSTLVKQPILQTIGAAALVAPHAAWAYRALEGSGNLEDIFFFLATVLLFVSRFLKKEKFCLCLGAAAILFVYLVTNLWAYELFFVVPAILLLALVERGSTSEAETKAETKTVDENPVFQARTGTDELVEKLSRLKELLDMGLITQEEFDQQKAKLLK